MKYKMKLNKFIPCICAFCLREFYEFRLFCPADRASGCVTNPKWNLLRIFRCDRSEHSVYSLLDSVEQIFQCANEGTHINELASRCVHRACEMGKQLGDTLTSRKIQFLIFAYHFHFWRAFSARTHFTAWNLAVSMYFWMHKRLDLSQKNYNMCNVCYGRADSNF